ncbi:Uncharacterised protein [Catenibacterium mitsuokai]|nr:Uncharacterised protein [Catenibacterium mitsuokai]
MIEYVTDISIMNSEMEEYNNETRITLYST